jgi:hypothetical protein
MQITGPNSISKFRGAINTNDLIPGSGIQAAGRTWSVPNAAVGSNLNILATITNTGPLGTEPDYQDYRYWVTVQQNNISSGSATVGAEWNLGPRYINGNQSTMSVVNPAEYKPNSNNSAGSHGLPVGLLVTLAPVYMDQSDGIAMPLVRWEIMPVGPQCFKVSSLPAAISGTVPPYAVCNSYSNTSTGSANVSVGVVVAHSPGDVLYANPVGSIMNSGTPLLDNMNKSIGWMEVGTYGTIFPVSLKQNGGSQGSAGSVCTYTYDVYEPSGTTKLIGTLSPDKIRLIATTVITPAAGGTTKGTAYLSNAGVWKLREADESFSEVPC